MKKFLSMVLCIVLMLSMAIPAIAAENEDTRQTVVSLEVDPSLEHYTLTIPSTIELDMAKEVNEIPVTLTDVTLCWSKNLDVYVTAQNAGEEAWETEVNDPDFSPSSYLIHTEDANKKILYGIKNFANSHYQDNQGIYVAFAYSYSDNGVQVEHGPLKIKLLGDYPGAGTYTDTLTFTVKLS